jgi:MFS family permease
MARSHHSCSSSEVPTDLSSELYHWPYSLYARCFLTQIRSFSSTHPVDSTQDMFLYGVIVPVIPFALQTRCHVEWNRVQYWVSVLVAIYGASLLALSPICGWLADRGASRRSPLLLGLFALLGSTILLNVGKSVGILIVGRVLQGASAAVV